MNSVTKICQNCKQEFVIEPEDASWGFTPWKGPRPKENWQYSSDTNEQWLTKEQLTSML